MALNELLERDGHLLLHGHGPVHVAGDAEELGALPRQEAGRTKERHASGGVRRLQAALAILMQSIRGTRAGHNQSSRQWGAHEYILTALFLRPKEENHSGPRRRMVGATDTVSTLVTVEGQPYSPTPAGKGGLSLGLPAGVNQAVIAAHSM